MGSRGWVALLVLVSACSGSAASDASPDAPIAIADGPVAIADAPGAADAGDVVCGAERCGPRQACVIPCCVGECLSPGPTGCPVGSTSRYCYPFPSDASTCEMDCEPPAPRCLDIPSACDDANLCACDAVKAIINLSGCTQSSPGCTFDLLHPRTVYCRCLRA